MADTLEVIWSNTDFPYMCLKDVPRTLEFKKAIEKTVKKGDVVVDVGSGSGILAFFAATAGAKKVFAVELDHMLAQSLRASVQTNGFEEIIEVVEQDILTVDLPKRVDVVVGEIMETGLIDELQVPALNELRRKGIIDQHTKIIPEAYKAYIELMYTDNQYYGYTILSPKHEWKFYSSTENGWHPTSFTPLTDKQLVASISFEDQIDPLVHYKAALQVKDQSKPVNALRLSGVITLCDGILLGPTNALNGDKILSIQPELKKSELQLTLDYEMGGGFKTFKLRCS